MCRWLAYQGEPTWLETLVSAPSHSLVAQSLHADEAKTTTNGDGFGLGWYGARECPGLYREIRPAWSDENLKSLCAQVQSHLFFAHVRASTGTAIARANCHPFVHGKMMFMHNGQIGNYAAIRRRLDMLIPDELYARREGSTDSEAIFLAAIGAGLEHDPVGALAATLNRVRTMMLETGTTEALRFTSAISNGEDLYAVRWASDERAPSLYYRETEDALVVVSEPLDSDRTCWKEVPKGCTLIARKGEKLRVRCMNEAMRLAA
ncbi:class II glutamine amidotransferase [Methylovirgula sp. 4M-Z18]|uniref:class II glutamine amidotransferase n=1 Tax=Methylovirgula sp. 4M-Z18 TaxID=2293567 RepID=UPI000E2ED997|nr:class II glutamine amidotransferase [Methylovirgula sp. 4M-Z18]RFB79725.1 class II glutamine amidotransferase [Methylovirgula sp. 4M-Z18]